MKKLFTILGLALALFCNAQITQINSLYCGYTATSTTDFIWADSLGLPSSTTNDRYNFKLVNGATTLTWTTNNQWPIFQWYLISGFNYNTTYIASVSWSSDNGATFGVYGSTCTVNSPSFPTTSLTPTYCNSSPVSYTSLIDAEYVAGATDYEYQLVNSALSYTQSYVKTNYNFILSQFTGLQNNTTYSVTARVKVNSIWGNFGNSCNITTPAGPTSSIISTECGNTASSYTSQLFHCEPITGFQCYFYNFTDGVTTYTLEKCNNNNFILSQLTPTLPIGTTFTVTVKVKLNGTYGSFGNACTLTTPATYMRVIKDLNGNIYDSEIENLQPGFYIINENGKCRKIIKQ